MHVLYGSGLFARLALELDAGNKTKRPRNQITQYKRRQDDNKEGNAYTQQIELVVIIVQVHGGHILDDKSDDDGQKNEENNDFYSSKATRNFV